MAKKKIIAGKSKKPDWKFIVLLLGILLVGLSVFVLNQKVTYKSSAYSGCADLYKNCKEDCKSAPNSGWQNTVNLDEPDGTKFQNTCLQHCKAEKRLCEQQQPAWRNQQQTQPAGTTFVPGAGVRVFCQGFNLTTCQGQCQGNGQCLTRCDQINNTCAQN